MPAPNPGGILAQGDVQDPVQLIFNAPVSANRPTNIDRITLTASQGNELR
jgi:hypothetical protein